MIKISVVLITLNEEKVIERTLQALQWCNEIVVVDSGSTDRTVAICQQYGCQVFYRKFDGYGPQKRFAVTKASHDWVLSMDADEIIPDELRNEIQSHLRTEPPVQGFLLPRSLVFMNKLLRFGGQYKSPVLRLFNHRFGNFNENRVHEGIELNGKTLTLKNHMLHYSYDSIKDYFDRFNVYTSAGATELYKRRKRSSKFHIFIRFPASFFSIYFLKGCVFDGYPGFVWSLFSAFYPVVKYIKLRELYDQGVEK